MPQALRLRGALDERALEMAANAIVERHEILRTRFVEINGEPAQVVAPFLRIALPLDDVSGLEAAAREEALAATLRRERDEPFDLSQGPLLRLRLLRLDAREHLLTFSCHHIISDGWSLAVFNQELTALYNSLVEGGEPRLKPLPIQYADYALWQRRHAEGETGRQLVDYWRHKLADAPPLLEIPTDNPRTVSHGNRGDSRSLQVSAELTGLLQVLCHREGVTLFMALLAAFKLLLSRLSGQEDIVVGTPMAGRNDVALEDLIGFFINTLVLRTDLSGNPSFTEALRRIRATTLEAFKHQDLPFERLVEKLQPERDLNISPLFQFFFNMISYQETPISLVGLEVESLDFPELGAKFDLTLYAMVRDSSILFQAVYNTELFSGETIERMLRQLVRLLEQIVGNPQEKIQNYSLVCVQDLRVLPDPRLPLRADIQPAMHEGFALQVNRVPHRTAVVDGEGSWSYAELDLASNKVAHVLRRKGLGRGEVVAVYATASSSLVCCLLGILKAGGAFVVLDCAYPAGRLHRYIEKAKPVALLHLEAAGALPEPLEKFAAGLRCRMEIPMRKELLLASMTGPDEGAPGISVDGGDPAYVIFTSGSTGQPLGILGTHQPVSHFLHWHIDTFGLGENDRFSLFSGVGHDILLRDMFTPLWLGASLHIPPQDKRETPGTLAGWMESERITASHTTPALAELLCDTGSSERPTLAALRWLFFGGDKLTHGLVQRVRRTAASCRLVNFYGTTETPQAMSFELIDANAPIRPPWEGVPIGKGIDGAQLLLLNPAEQQAGIGEFAEICVRTPYLSTSYLDEEQLTRERFLTNPFTSAVDDPIYRTGDMGRYRPDGSVTFAGRRDQQIKLRGFRVELAEVEAALRNCAGVRECTVVVGLDDPGEKRLLAYVAPYDVSSAPSTAQLLDVLRRNLPDHMVPAAIVMIEKLPLTPNGKIDHKALPPPDFSRAQSGPSYEAPRTHAEQIMTSIWAEVLNLEQIGIHDNFFEMGGHSLLAIKFVSLLRERTGFDLPMRMLFESPTPAALAERFAVEDRTPGTGQALDVGAQRFIMRQIPLDAAASGHTAISEILGKQVGFIRTWKGKRRTPDSFIVTLNEAGKRQGLFWCLQGYRALTQLATYLGPDQPVHGMRSGHLIMDYTDVNLHAIASHYAAEMIAFQPQGPFLLGGNCQGGTIAHSIALRLRELGRTVSVLVLMELTSFAPYADPVALIFGRESHHNPYKPGADPDTIFRLSYPAGYTVDLIAGAHGEFFESPNAETLASALRRLLPNPSDKKSTHAPLM